MAERLLVTGAGGFIGHHLVKYLVARGYCVRGADIKHPAYEPSPAHEFAIVDLRRPEACLTVTRDVSQIYHLASDMGIGHVTAERAKVARNNIVMDVHVLDAARLNHVQRFLFARPPASTHSSSRSRRRDSRCARTMPGRPIRRRARPRQALHREAVPVLHGGLRLETRVARFHNVYGPLGSYDGGRRRRRPRSAARSPSPRPGARSTSGATAADAVVHLRR